MLPLHLKGLPTNVFDYRLQLHATGISRGTVVMARCHVKGRVSEDVTDDTDVQGVHLRDGGSGDVPKRVWVEANSERRACYV